MKISFGLSSLLTPRRWRLAKRGSAFAGLVWGGFTFLTFELVRNDAHFSTSAWFPSASKLTVELMNQASVPMHNTNISFRFFDAEGTIVLMDTNEDGIYDDEDLPDHQFAPRSMSIAPSASKIGDFYEDQFESVFKRLEYIKICAIHDGSFWVDKVKVTYLLGRSRDDTFRQQEYEKKIFFFREPTCQFSKKIDPV